MKSINETDFKAWLELKGLSRKTIKNYLFYFGKLELLNSEYMTLFLKRYNNIVSRAFLKNFISYIKESQSPEVKALVLDFEMPKITGRKKKKLPNILTLDQIKELALGMNSDRDALMVLISFYCGLRMGELLSIKPGDFNFKVWIKNKTENGLLRVTGKGKKERIVPVPAWFMNSLLSFANEQHIIKPYGPADLLFNIRPSRWQDILNKAALKVLGRRVNPHLLRHSCGAYLRDNGWELDAIKEFLGHESITSTVIYTHLSKEKIKSMYKQTFNT